MSNSSLLYYLDSKWGNRDVCPSLYEFQHSGVSSIVSATGSGSSWTGCFLNYSGASVDKIAVATSISETSSGAAEASLLNSLSIGDGLDLSKTNLKIDSSGIDLEDSTLIMDFSINAEVSSSVLFGSFEKNIQALGDGSSVLTSKGFNVGLTDRGHLFLQAANSNGDFLSTISETEISKRNVVAIEGKGGDVEISVLDLFNNSAKEESFNIGSNYITSPDYFYIGGSNEFYSSESGEDETSDITLHSFSILNGTHSEGDIIDFYKSSVGDVEVTTGSFQTVVKITGATETIVYNTGITGWDETLVQIGEEPTTRTFISGGYSNPTAGEVTEGELIQDVRSFASGNFAASYISEYGNIDDSDVGYNPTGDNAESILGLKTDLVSGITHYTTITETTTGTTPIFSTVRTPLTGNLNSISGTIVTYLSGVEQIFDPNTIEFGYTGESEGFKKDYLYYMGERL